MTIFSGGSLLSNFFLCVTLPVVFLQLSSENHLLDNNVVRGLCQAQCMSLTHYLQAEAMVNCLGPPDHSFIPYEPAWLIDCKDEGRGPDFIDCVGTCSAIKFKSIGYIPAKPEVSAFLDIRSKNITLKWQPDTKVSPSTIYVVSMLEDWKPPHQWDQIATVHGGNYTVGPVGDICTLPSFRVAAVNRFGSRWFCDETKIPANIPGRPRNVHVTIIEYDKDNSEMLFILQWQPPSGWDIDDIARVHNITTTIRCSAENWEKVYVMVDSVVAHNATNKVEDEDHFTMKGRVSVNAIGCTIIFQISVSSRCNTHWIGPAEEFHLAFKCSDIMQYKGEYCRNPPVLRPGPVTQLRLTLIPLTEGVMGLVSWQPPKDIGTAGKVDNYHLFYGVVNLKSSAFIKEFEGSPEHVTVKGDTFSKDIFMNITTLESYETVGVMVRAAGPGQIIESPFGDIIFADNTDALLHTKTGHLYSDDDTVIVVASSENYTQETGIGVEIFWRRPNHETALDIVAYAVEWRRLHSNYTSHLDDEEDDVTPATKKMTMIGV